MRSLVVLLSMVLLLNPSGASAQRSSGDGSRLNSRTFSGLELRNIGPAFMSGRIADVVKNPQDRSVWYMAVSSGSV